MTKFNDPKEKKFWKNGRKRRKCSIFSFSHNVFCLFIDEFMSLTTKFNAYNLD